MRGVAILSFGRSLLFRETCCGQTSRFYLGIPARPYAGTITASNK
jgi:hypothetical protein